LDHHIGIPQATDLTMTRPTETCVICEHPIVSTDDFLVFSDRGPAFVHADCEDSNTWQYGIVLRELVQRSQPDGVPPCTFVGWRDHMREKNWFTPEMDAALIQASELAEWFRRRRPTA
jgi:hypothetical protein